VVVENCDLTSVHALRGACQPDSDMSTAFGASS
jgi:hypothetical protein